MSNLARRPLPVLVQKREQRENLDARLERSLHRLPHGLHPGAVAQRARQVALPRPAPVAVHDDGHGPGHSPLQPDVRERLVRH